MWAIPPKISCVHFLKIINLLSNGRGVEIPISETLEYSELFARCSFHVKIKNVDTLFGHRQIT